MRHVRFLLLLAGLGGLVFLVVRIGPASLAAAFAQVRWWQFLLVCLPYGLIMVVDTLGWRYAFRYDRAPFHRLLGARMAGDALNVATALASVGGEAMKAWLIRRDVPYEESVPALVVAKTTATVSQALFLIVGIVLALAALPLQSHVVRIMLWLLVVEVVAVGGFFLVQVTGLVRRGGRLLRWFGMADGPSHADRLDRALREYYRRDWRRFALSTGFHFLGWLLGAVETYLMLVVLDVGIPLVTATVIEAFGSAVRFASFLVPASIGALEGANAAIFPGLGSTGSAGLAFTLVRRGRQTVWIMIGLLTLVGMRFHASLRARRAPARSVS
ncbi:MAG TPA: lysylphosphatidylglycerol synthase transmembrane domain-containing protein [Methylomirabilota bacterium]